MPVDPSRLCKCHDEPMFLNINDGHYRCIVKKRAIDRRWNARHPEAQWSRERQWLQNRRRLRARVEAYPAKIAEAEARLRELVQT